MSEDKLTYEQKKLREKYNVYFEGRQYHNLGRYVIANFDNKSVTDLAKDIGVGRSTIQKVAKENGLTKISYFKGLLPGEKIVDLKDEEHPWNEFKFTSMGRLIRKSDGLIKKPKNSHGYLRYEVEMEEGYKGISQHVLLAKYFIPNEDPETKIDVNHKDGVRDNNSLSNLEWVSRRENILHAREVLKREGMFGEGSNLAKITEEQAKTIIHSINMGMTNKEIAETLPYATISMVRSIKFNGVWSSLDHLKEWDKDTFKERMRNLDRESVIAIRLMSKKTNISNSSLAKYFDVTESTIHEILTYKTYKDVSL